VKYSQHQASNKEKVAASSIRALGFIVQNLIRLEQPLLTAEQIDQSIRLIMEVIINKLKKDG